MTSSRQLIEISILAEGDATVLSVPAGGYMRLPLDFLESWMAFHVKLFFPSLDQFWTPKLGLILPTTPNDSKEKHGANVTQYTLVVEWLVPQGRG